MNYRYIFVLVGALVTILVIRQITEPKIIFTCTTFFDFAKMDRWASFQRAITEFYRLNQDVGKITTWLIVNEYSETPKADWAKHMRETFPQMTFIQKNKDQKGQAASLNIVLDHIKPYTYWIQWEDTWFPEHGFLGRAIDIMNNSSVSQLQFTKLNGKVNWLDIPQDRQVRQSTPQGSQYIVVKAVPDIQSTLQNSPYEFRSSWRSSWPLFSLLPSINRVSHLSTLGQFSTDPVLWPVKFEWDYARRWYTAGGKKAVLPDGPVIREGHVSTYSK